MSDNRPMKINTDTIYDKVLAHHIDPLLYPLTDKEADQLLRWNEAFALMLNHYSKMDIVRRWITQKGLSQGQAYKDIADAEKLFGSVLKADKEGSRAMWIEWTKDLLMRAKQKGDLKAEAKALEMLAKYSGFDEEDVQFNRDKLANINLHFEIPKTVIAAEEKASETAVFDFNRTDALDIDFEELNNEINQDNAAPD